MTVFTRRLLLWLAVPAALLILLLGGLLWAIGDWSSPSRTLEAFCQALVTHDYATAYAHLSQAYQERLPYPTFVTTYRFGDGEGAVTACRVKWTRSDMLFGTFGTLDFVSASGTTAEHTFALQTEHLLWKISPASLAWSTGMIY